MFYQKTIYRNVYFFDNTISHTQIFMLQKITPHVIFVILSKEHRLDLCATAGDTKRLVQQNDSK